MIADHIEIPLFDGEKTAKNACSGPSQTKTDLASGWFHLTQTKFRYAALQRNFFGLTAELNG
jgi:hypothetical protein